MLIPVSEIDVSAIIMITTIGVNLGGIIWAGSKLSTSLGIKIDNVAKGLTGLTDTVNRHGDRIGELETDVAVVETQVSNIQLNGCALGRELHK